MKTKKYVIIGYILILLFLMVTGCGHQDLSTNPAEENVETEENGDDVTVKDILIHSKEEARDIMKDFLREKYNEDYIVDLPGITEENDYIATAYIDGSEESIRVAVDAYTGRCRDNGCLKDIQSYLENSLEKKLPSLWEQAEVQVYCKFSNEVPKIDRTNEDAIEDILKEEQVNGGICLMIQKDRINKEEEALLIQQLFNTEELEGFFCELNAYYVSSDLFDHTMDAIQDGTLIISTSCATDYNEYVRVFLKLQTNDDYLEEIKDGFRE